LLKKNAQAENSIETELSYYGKSNMQNEESHLLAGFAKEYFISRLQGKD
jgi:hypothetical protein